MTRILRTMAVSACGLLGACATMMNPGRISNADPLTGPTGATTARVQLRHWSPDIRIYADGVLLPVYDADPAFSARLSADCLELQQTMARGGPADPARCAFVSPVLVLPKRANTLRLVRGAQEATVVMKPSFHWGWFFGNWVWLTFAPVGWAVDLAGGRWTYFSMDGLDVAAAFQGSARQVSGSGQ